MINSLKTLVFSANAPFISGGGSSHVSNHFQYRSRIATVALLLLTFSFFNITSARAEKLCQSNYTGEIGTLGSKTVQVSVGTIGTNMYRVVFESDFAMTGSLTYVNTSVNNNLCLDNTTKTILDGGKRIFFDMPSTSAPVFKNDIQVKTSAGNFPLTGTAVNSVDWSQTTAECSALVGNDCSGRSTEKSEGNDFTNGYEYDFSSDGSGNVYISIKFLDEQEGMEKPQLFPLNPAGGEIGPNPFMTWNSSTHTASHTLTGQTGTIYFKVRVPYSGGVFVTKKFTIKVGEPCDAVGGCDEPLCGEPDETTIWFLNTNNWADNFTYAYMWSGATKNGDYPGVVMTRTDIVNKDSKRLYSITFDKDQYVNVKFNCNSNDNGCYTGDLSIEPFQCYNFASGWVNRPCSVVVATDANSYSTSADPMAFQCNSLDYIARVTFTAGNHAFKIVATDNGNNYWYGCTPGTTPTASFSNYAFSTSGGNMPFTADVPGDYYFAFNYATQTVSVTYPPYMTSASLDTKTSTTAIINVTSTRGTQYHVVDSSNGIDQVLTPTSNQITVTGLTEGTLYTFTVTALDDNDTESSNSITLDLFCTLLETAPTAPTYEECQVLSVYSQYYRSLQASFSHWEGGSTQTDRVVDGVNMWEVNVGTAWTDGGYGIEWGNQTFDISDYTGLHFDIWTPTATTIYVTPINRNSTDNGNDPEVRHSGIATTARGWTSVNIPISEFTGPINRNYQLKIEGNKGTPMFITNIFYYKTAECPSDPTSTACSGMSDEVIEPATPFNYGYDFSTLPNGDVQIQFEWLGDGEPANIYFHDYTSGGMVESPMTRSGKVGTITITDKKTGDILIFGCKFDKDGVKRTRRFVYKVGYDCGKAECGESGNIAAGKLAKAGYSRMYDAGRGGRNDQEQPQMALDGKTNTHFIAWGADGADKDAYRWWAVDLGAEYNLKNVKIYWQEAGRSSEDYILQTRSDLSADFENDAAYSNTGWTTIKTVTGTQAIGSANSYDVTGQGRYLRLVANDRKNIAISEFEVYVSGCVSDDSNPPTMGSATYVSNNDKNTGVILELTATDSEGEVSHFRLDEVGGGSTFVNTDGSHRVTLDGIASGSHTYHVYAIDGSGNVSADYAELSFCFVNPAENLALNKTCYAGHETNDANEAKEKANDGILDNFWTSWAGEINTDDWWYVDLGDIYRLSTIDLYWYLDGGKRLGSEDYIIQVRQTAPVGDQVTEEDEWTTVAHETNPKCGQTENTDKNSYPVDIDARFVRVQSKQRNSANQQIRLNEMLVYGSACGSPDSNAPVVNASLYSVGVGQAVLSVSATDQEDGAIYDFYVTNNVTGETSVLTDEDHDGQITITGLEGCVTYSFTIKAKDKAVNWSNNASVDGVTPTIDHTVNLALHATTSAGHTENDASATTANAVDGNSDTQWNGTGADAGTNEWFMVDLGAKYDLQEVKILWSKIGDTDDGGTYPVDYKLQGSSNGTDFYTFAHYASKTETGKWLDYTTTDPLPARYVRVWVDQHSTYAMGIRELQVYSKDECFVEKEPIITFAEITNLTPSGVTVSCDAYAHTTNMAGMSFYYELTNKETNSTTTGTLTHTNGSITITDLEPNINYSLRIYAEITSSSVRSTNYKELTFNVTYSTLHYLTEETECNWQAGLYNTEWQFAFTDRYSPTEKDKGGNPLRILEYTHHTISHHVETTPPTIQYKLYEAGFGGIWTSGENLFFRNPENKQLKMYALGTEKFVCNLDELYVSGEAVGGRWEVNNKPSSDKAANYQMRYDDQTGLFSWTGDVVPGTGKYFKIVIRDIRSVDATADTWAYNRIMQANATYDRDWTRATLYFDMRTWTWWWESAMDGCIREGGSGVVNTDNGGTPFTEGYKLHSYVVTENENKYFIVEAESYDENARDNAILHIYKNENSADVTEVSKDGAAKTYTVGSTTHTYYRFKKLVTDIPEAINGIIRYYVKFEGSNGLIKNTKYYYYDLPNTKCEPDTWIIYHHDQAPEAGDRETFDGGQIVQPIEYRRKFDLDTWYSLYLPFEVTAVKVISGGKYYDLLPYYRKSDGTLKGKQYIIRKATPVTNMPIVNVENRLPSESSNGWFDPTESEYKTFLPQKNTPYLIQFHNPYYEDKWIAFFGKRYSTIDTDLSANAAPTNDEVVNIYGNNTMQNQFLSGQCYQLNYAEYDSYAWTRFDNVTLYPFECYILANPKTTAKYRILRRGAAEDTPTGMEDVYEENGDIRVYTIAGQYLCTLHNMSPDEAGQHLQSRLTEGVYILRTPTLSYKLIIGGF